MNVTLFDNTQSTSFVWVELRCDRSVNTFQSDSKRFQTISNGLRVSVAIGPRCRVYNTNQNGVIMWSPKRSLNQCLRSVECPSGMFDEFRFDRRLWEWSVCRFDIRRSPSTSSQNWSFWQWRVSSCELPNWNDCWNCVGLPVAASTSPSNCQSNVVSFSLSPSGNTFAGKNASARQNVHEKNKKQKKKKKTIRQSAEVYTDTVNYTVNRQVKRQPASCKTEIQNTNKCSIIHSQLLSSAFLACACFFLFGFRIFSLFFVPFVVSLLSFRFGLFFSLFFFV